MAKRYDKETKDKAIELIARGKSQTEAAAAIGVHQATVSRWLNDPEFRAQVVEISAKMWDLGGVQMSGLFALANAKALELLNDPDVDIDVKMRIVRSIWSVAPRVFELATVNEALNKIQGS